MGLGSGVWVSGTSANDGWMPAASVLRFLGIRGSAYERVMPVSGTGPSWSDRMGAVTMASPRP
jgi:hypothetical protein